MGGNGEPGAHLGSSNRHDAESRAVLALYYRALTGVEAPRDVLDACAIAAAGGPSTVATGPEATAITAAVAAIAGTAAVAAMAETATVAAMAGTTAVEVMAGTAAVEVMRETAAVATISGTTAAAASTGKAIRDGTQGWSASTLWQKVALTHRAGHRECGTFRFSFARDARHFERRRPASPPATVPVDATEFERFLACFPDAELAREIFEHCEDFRVDETIRRRYAGLRPALRAVQDACLGLRPALAGMTPADALCEVLVRASLGARLPSALPNVLREPARIVYEQLQILGRPDAVVEDSAEAAWRIAELVVGHSDAESPIVVAPVPYRDRLGSGWTQETSASDGRDSPPTGSGALQANGDGKFIDDGVLPSLDAERAPTADRSMGDGELAVTAPGTFVYPEWDHVAARYRRRWCRLREIRVEPGASARYFDETIAAYGALVPEIRREIERLVSEALRKRQRMRQGVEIDLDAAIATIIDRRSGVPPAEEVYVARERLARDIAVAFLVDLSYSTSADAKPPQPGSEALPLRSGQELHGRRYRTILDLEKESLVLLMAALERLGDAYGIYGFSGQGRERCDFLVVKEMNERLSDRVAARIDGLAPRNTTRMGPALRHATDKLRAQEARTRLLLLLSDGRPFDLDYGQQYGRDAELRYAVHDTRQALDEARQSGIAPFVLTIDPQGNDYLRTLCGGPDYEVLKDVNELPARLLMLYRRLSGR